MISQVAVKSSTSQSDPNRLGTGRFRRQQKSFIATTASTTSDTRVSRFQPYVYEKNNYALQTPLIHSYPPQPLKKSLEYPVQVGDYRIPIILVMTEWLQASENPHCYPLQPLAEAPDDGSLAIMNPGPVTTPKNHPSVNGGDNPLSATKGVDPLLPPSVVPPPPADTLEIKTEKKAVDNSGLRIFGNNLPQSSSTVHGATTTIDRNGTNSQYRCLCSFSAWW